jgi:hypothetical protein
VDYERERNARIEEVELILGLFGRRCARKQIDVRHVNAHFRKTFWLPICKHAWYAGME